MKIMKYRANTMPEAIEKIKKDLGPDAVILNSKDIKQGGLFGIFKKRQVEVFAAIDSSPVPKTNKPRTLSLNKEKMVRDQLESKQKRQKINVYNDSNDEHEKVLAEIKHVKQLLLTNSVPYEQPFSANFAIVYNYLLTQEVDDEIAKNIVDSLVHKFESDDVLPEQIMPHVQDEIVTLLPDSTFSSN